MKKLLLLVLACGICIGTFAQDNTGCCYILESSQAAKKIIARNRNTGLIFQFGIDPVPTNKNSIKNNNVDLDHSGNKVIAVNGIPCNNKITAYKSYSIFAIDLANARGSTPISEMEVPTFQNDSIDFQRYLMYATSQDQRIEIRCSEKFIEEMTTNPFQIGPIKMLDKQLALIEWRHSNNPDGLLYGFSISDLGDTQTSTASVTPKGWDQKINIKTRPNTSETDKWVITPVKDMKGVLGRLDINFPSDVERNILIYQQTDNEFLRSVSRNDKIYTIAPGQYRFTLTSVPVENVPIQKGHETRLKAGFLNIVSEGDWHLYNETKEKAYTSGNKPKKLPLPIGSYQLKLGLDFYPFVIKDGETVEY